MQYLCKNTIVILCDKIAKCFKEVVMFSLDTILFLPLFEIMFEIMFLFCAHTQFFCKENKIKRFLEFPIYN